MVRPAVGSKPGPFLKCRANAYLTRLGALLGALQRLRSPVLNQLVAQAVAIVLHQVLAIAMLVVEAQERGYAALALKGRHYILCLTSRGSSSRPTLHLFRNPLAGCYNSVFRLKARSLTESVQVSYR